MASSKRSADQGGGTAIEPEPEPEPAPSPVLEQLKETIVAELPPEPQRPTAPASAPPTGDDDELGEIENTLTDLASNPEKASEFTEEEWADLWELPFGMVADDRGPHWELQRKRALRLGKYTRKAIAQYGGVPESWVKHIPLLMLALLLAATVFRAWREDQKVNSPPPLELHKRTETGAGEGTP